jgi:hypothetical protein
MNESKPKLGRGGSRPGAGRKKIGSDLTQHFDNPEDFLRAVMNNHGASEYLRVQAAKALMAKTAEGGKKVERERAAEEAQSGRFAPQVVPRLVSNG